MSAQGGLVDDSDSEQTDDAESRMARILASVGVIADRPVSSIATAAVWALWPDNVPVWNVWASLRTQWRRSGLDGKPCGLDYTAVWAVLDHSRIPKRQRRWAFETIRGMEAAALSVWALQQ